MDKIIPTIRICSICGERVRKNSAFYPCPNCGLLLEKETELKDMSINA